MIEGWIQRFTVNERRFRVHPLHPIKTSLWREWCFTDCKTKLCLIFDVKLLKIEKPASKAETESKEAAKK